MTCLYGTRFYVKLMILGGVWREHSSLRLSLYYYIYFVIIIYKKKRKKNEGKKLNVNHLPRTTVHTNGLKNVPGGVVMVGVGSGRVRDEGWRELRCNYRCIASTCHADQTLRNIATSNRHVLI